MMLERRIGALIREGPSDWTILQQQQGQALVRLCGDWLLVDEIPVEKPQVFARVVHEEDGAEVVPWQPGLTSAAGEWSVELGPIAAGGLYRIETCLQIDPAMPVELAWRGDMIHHIGVGDLWLIAGQSNASGFGRGPAADPPELGVHLLRNSGHWDLATHPLNEATATTHLENQEPVNPGHSPFLAFARLLKRKLGYPIGLLPTALSGSPLNAWNPAQDGFLYHNMLRVARAAGGRVKGVLWYQGEMDVAPADAASYLGRFSSVVQQWRRDLDDPQLPFLTVQLNRTLSDLPTAQTDLTWSQVREAQRQAAQRLLAVFIVPALDCTLSDFVHNSPPANIVIGERLARTALTECYGRGSPSRAPDIAFATFGPPTEDDRTTISLSFANVQGLLQAVGPRSGTFAAEDENGPLRIEDWDLPAGDEVRLILSYAPRGRTLVHGLYGRNPSGALLVDSRTNLPMLAFCNVEVGLASA